jgi:CHAT domain-containing protein
MMDELLQHRYVTLIEQILCSNPGQEILVVQRHLDLLDGNLLTVAEQQIRRLQSQGHSDANRLKALLPQLAHWVVDRATLLMQEAFCSHPVSEQRADKFEVVIHAYEEALQVHTRENLPERWADINCNLALAYMYRILGERSQNVECAISALQNLLQVNTREAYPTQWAETQNNLANAYRERIQGDKADNIEQAIAFCHSALSVLTYEAQPTQWAGTQNNLAIAYLSRVRGDQAENIEQAITASQLALRVYSYEKFPKDWADTKSNLAGAYVERIRGDRADNIEQAIMIFHDILQVYTRDAYPIQWADTQNNLASAYRNRIRGNQAENIEQAIPAFSNALQVFTQEAFPLKWADTQNNLADAYRESIRGNRAYNFECAITACKKALQIFTKEAFPLKWADTENRLASIYLSRIQGDRVENIEQAIAACENALQIYTQDAFPRDWAAVQNNLAVAYRTRIRGNRAENIRQAIATYYGILQVYTREALPQKWADTQINLAHAYITRILEDRAQNIEQAIAACQNALQVYTFEAFPTVWADIQIHLGNAYCDRIQGEQEENLKQAITAYENALQVHTLETFSERWAMIQLCLATAHDPYVEPTQTNQTQNVEQAIAAYENASRVYTPRNFPNDCRRTYSLLGNLYFNQRNWVSSLEAYASAMEAGESLYQSCILLESQAAELRETDDLPRRIAYALAQIGQFGQSVLAIEQGRARGLSETLDRDRANLTQLQHTTPQLYERYQDITNQLRNLESQQRDRSISSERHSLTPETLRNAATQLRSELETTIAQIRQVEGYEDFLDQPNFEDIRAALQPKCPLIYLVVTSAGSLALIITPDEIANLWLDDLTEASLQELLQTWFNAYNQSQSDRQNWLDAIDSVTHQLWKPLMEPLISHLKSHNFDQVVLVPTGYLSLLPLHAAWTEDSISPTGRHYALDDIHFTYAPNARSLTAAQAIATRAQANSILAIDNPTQDLKDSEREVQAAISNFRQHTVLRHTEATIKAVRSHLSEARIVHFACHGKAELIEPLTSGLEMSDGRLTLRDILALNLSDHGGIRLAILSACETGLSGIENADEAISLPTGFLQAGVAGVIASLWVVSDLSTMLLITKFYDLWREQNLPPDQALRQAQFWLRDITEGEIASLLGQRTRTPDRRPFAHPYYWSAFTYTGV